MSQNRVREGRVYDQRAEGDGRRILVDRLWPRGVKKDDDRIDEWLPEVAPSTELRKWYGHDPARYDEFSERYKQELHAGSAAALAQLVDHAREGTVTLLTATKDLATSEVPLLARVVRGSL